MMNFEKERAEAKKEIRKRAFGDRKPDFTLPIPANLVKLAKEMDALSSTAINKLAEIQDIKAELDSKEKLFWGQVELDDTIPGDDHILNVETMEIECYNHNK